MKTTTFFLLSLLVFGQLFSQTQLQHNSLRKEYSHEVFSYNDGSFSVLTSNRVIYGSAGQFVTYNSAGEVQFENNNIDVTEDGLLYSNDMKVFVDAARKGVLFLGQGEKGIVLRKIDHKGNITDVIVRHKETPSLKNYLKMSGSAWTSGNTISAVVSNILSPKNDNAVLITFNIDNLSYVIKPLEKSRIKGPFGNLIFIGEKNADLLFLSPIPGNITQSEIVRVKSDGSIHAFPVTLNKAIDEVTSQLTKPVDGGNPEQLCFSVGSLGGNYTIFKISMDTEEIEYVDYRFSKELSTLENSIPKKWHATGRSAVPLTRCALFYLINVGDEEKLFYSREGYNIVLLKPDWNNHEIGAFDREHYIGPIQMSSWSDLQLYLKKMPELEDLKEQIFACGTDHATCLFTVRAINNSDGSQGFVVITGDKVEEKGVLYTMYDGSQVEIKPFYYENIKILKY